ncbi:uncharacterized protein LOC144441117 [Glandiceps talaboti]
MPDFVKEAVNTIADSVTSDDCIKLARKLGVDDVSIDDIQRDHSGAREQRYQMLKKWTQMVGKDATLEKLYTALTLNGNKKVVDKLKAKYSASGLDKDLKKLSLHSKGPTLPRRTHIKDMDFDILSKLCLLLNVENATKDDWRKVAGGLGYDTTSIHTFQRQKDPMDELLKTWSVKKEATVGKLYDILIKGGLTTAASLL